MGICCGRNRRFNRLALVQMFQSPRGTPPNPKQSGTSDGERDMFSLSIRKLRGISLQWSNVRGLAESATTYKKRIMNNFTQYLNGKGSQEIVFQVLKMCSSGMRTELPKSRVSLADSVYASVKEKGLPFTTPLYNSLLQVYLTNRHSFSPADFLSNMREDGAIPNRGTLTMLLQGYCQGGNMTGAKQILSELKERDMTIGEEAYAALIQGHALAGDLDSAQQIISIMKEGELRPGMISYSALLSGYGFHGDLDSIRSLIGKMKEERIFVSYNVFAEIIDALSRGGHHQKIPEVLNMIRNKEWMYNELIHKAEDLSSRGEGQSSLHILDCLGKLRLVGDGQYHLDKACCATLWNIVYTDHPLDFVLSALSSLASAERANPQSLYEETLKAFFTSEKWDDGKTLILEMEKKGLTVKPHYLYPPFAACARKQNIKEYLQWFELINDDRQPDIMIADYALSSLKRKKKGIVRYLKDENIPLTKSLVKLITLIHCKHQQYEALYEFLSSADQSIIPASFILDSIATYCKNKPQSVEILEKLFIHLAPMCELKDLNRALHLIVTNLVQNEPGRTTYMFVKNLFSKKAIQTMNSSTCNLVLVSLNEKELIDDVFEFLRLMKFHNIPIDNHHRRQILKISAKTGTSVFAAQSSFKKMKESGIADSSVYSNFIIALSKGKKHYIALKHYEEIKDNPDYRLSIGAYLYLIQGYIYNKDFDSANEIKSLLLERGIKPGLFMFNLFMEGFVRTGDAAGVQAEFDQLVSSGITPNVFSYHKLMQSYALQDDLDNVRNVLEKAETSGTSINREMIETLVDACLSSGDLHSALEYLHKYSTVTPSIKTFMDVIESSIRSGDRELIDRATDTLRSTGASADVVNHTLMFSLIRCDRLDDAMELARRECTKINLDLVNELAKSCQISGNVQCLVSLMNLLREFGIKPYMLHIPLIKALAVNKDINSLLTTAKDLQSLGETPKQSFHMTLSMLLKQIGEESPYVYTGLSGPNVAAAASVTAN